VQDHVLRSQRQGVLCYHCQWWARGHRRSGGDAFRHDLHGHQDASDERRGDLQEDEEDQARSCCGDDDCLRGGGTKQGKEGALIMVVDDNPGTCTTLENVLATKGYRVGIAHTGEEAIIMARKKSYDIIFIDIKLPTINGLELYLSIRQINPEAVAIMMTAYRQEMAQVVEEALRNNAYTCLYKPLDMEEVLRGD